MIKDAEAHADEDRQRREEADLHNQADTLVYQTEKLLREQGEKVPEADKEAVQASLGRLKDAKEGTDTEAVKSAIEDLMTTSQAFTQKLYEAASAESAGQYDGEPSASGANAADDDEVVDAEVIDEDDK
jgi:molecular chaperone DnaK